MKTFESLINKIKSYDGPGLTFMEVCGTHTHSIFRHGIRGLLPPSIRLISGPGCPVCVTPADYIDEAAQISKKEGHVLCTFGDMIRVPGNKTSLSCAKAEGGRVRLLYSPMEMLDLAEKEPSEIFCMAAVGFETTLPAYALMIKESVRKKLKNVRFLMAPKALLPALSWICENEPRINGFIGPGHVSAVIGANAYRPLCKKYRVPLAVAGFKFEHIIAAIYDLIKQCKSKSHDAHNLYKNAVSDEGNTEALRLISSCFVKKPSLWRGLGLIDDSGYFLSPEFRDFDAGENTGFKESPSPEGCRCGDIITGRLEPKDCVLFGRACTPLHPIGPCMVSGEGACGIYYKGPPYRKELL